MKRICFYHAGCPDGFGAAWSAWTAWGDTASYVPISHDDELDIERCEAAHVAFVDIIPPNESLVAIGEVADQLVVLDHHISSLERYQSDMSAVNAIEEHGHLIHFDLSHSGAALSWSHFRPTDEPPDLIRYIEDRDLWNWKLPRSQEVTAAISSYPMRFETWSELAARPIEELAVEGEPIVRSNRVEVERALHHAHPITIGERRLEAVNASHERAAVGHQLAQRAAYGSPCGCVYRVSGDLIQATLYSIGDFDVSKIAGSFGGGGHRNAAGFTVPLDRWLDEFVD